MTVPTRQHVIETLRPHADELRAAGMQALYLFGSVARGDAGPESDVDLFFEHRKGMGLEVLGLMHRIEDLMDYPVDVATRGSLHPALRANIESEAVKIF